MAYDRDDNVVGVFDPPVTIDPFQEKLAIVDYPIELIEVAAGFTSPLAGVVSPVAALRNQLFIVEFSIYYFFPPLSPLLLFFF